MPSLILATRPLIDCVIQRSYCSIQVCLLQCKFEPFPNMRHLPTACCLLPYDVVIEVASPLTTSPASPEQKNKETQEQVRGKHEEQYLLLEIFCSLLVNFLCALRTPLVRFLYVFCTLFVHFWSVLVRFWSVFGLFCAFFGPF